MKQRHYIITAKGMGGEATYKASNKNYCINMALSKLKYLLGVPESYMFTSMDNVKIECSTYEVS